MMIDEFNFPEIDKIGIENLDSISFAPSFNEYMYDTIKEFCKGDVLEIGSGTGNISKYFIRDNWSITLSDIRENYVSHLNQTVGKKNNIDILNLNIVEPEFDSLYSKYFNSFDTIFALNVVEHIKDHELSIMNCYKLLKDDGNLVILVPAYNCLYNSFDKALEHYRRYTRKSLEKIISPHLNIVKTKYFNVFGILGWFVSGSLLKREHIKRSQMELYDKLILVSKALDKIVMNKIGLSVISIGKKISK